MKDEIKFANRSAKLCYNTKAISLETTLKQSLTNFKELVLEFEEICIESDRYKNQILEQKQKCENKSCASSEAFKKIIILKDTIIQSVATILIELNETKNFNVISDAFRIISGEQLPLTPPVSADETPYLKIESLNSHKEDQNVSLPDLCSKNTPTLEIEDALSGRKSPIIQSKILKNALTSVSNSKVQEKNKCPEIWPTPEKKAVKLTFPTPTRGKTNGKLKQARLNLVKVKSSTVVDLTSSPEALGYRSFQSEGGLQNIKMEVIENDDTIMPSPTSGPINFQTVFKTVAKDSPSKSKKNSSVLRLKCKDDSNLCVTKDNNKSIKDDTDIIEMEGSINILNQPSRRKNSPSKFRKPLSVSKLKTECTTFIDYNDENTTKEIDESMNILKHFPNSPLQQARCTPGSSNEPHSEDVNESMSLLQRINKFDDNSQDIKINLSSPSKRPLSENNNIGNIPSPCDIEASMSLLQTNIKTKIAYTIENGKRTKADLIEPVFKEPTVRKKLEKRALPGWSCDECKQFYDELYKDDPERLRQKMEECSRHRGRRDPARPRTPPGFWRARWHVPQDTDEFNRLNGAL